MQNRIDEVLKKQGKKYADLVPLTGLSDYGIGKWPTVPTTERLVLGFLLPGYCMSARLT